MFRRRVETLPNDPIVPADLTGLGYFINEKDQIREVRNPAQKYQYAVSKNDRVNEVYKEAMNTCTRNIVSERLSKLEMQTVRLPIGATAEQNHVPILVSKDLASKKRVIVFFGERSQDLGIFSYRKTGEIGINSGSAVDFCSAVLNTPPTRADDGSTGVVLANPGQLLWFRGGERAVTFREWQNLPRKSAVHEAMRIDSVRNAVPGNRNYEEHVQYVFEHVMRGLAHPEAVFDVIGLEYTGRAVLKYLANNWSEWHSKISGICLGSPQHTVADLQPDGATSTSTATTSPSNTPSDRLKAHPDFPTFVRNRTRAYVLFGDLPVETPAPGLKEFGCNAYSSGEPFYQEDLMVPAWRSMLDWFNVVRGTGEAYREPEFRFVEEEVVGKKEGWGEEESEDEVKFEGRGVVEIE